MWQEIDIFDTSDIIEEFDEYQDKSHCYAYVTTDILKAIARFCFDMNIALPENVQHLKSKRGEPVIFSETIYSPKQSSVSGKSLYESMIDNFSFYNCSYLYGFIDGRMKKNSFDKLSQFYQSIRQLETFNIIEKIDSFSLKEQKITQ